MEINGEKEWVVEEILDSKLVRKRLKYKAKWLGNDDNAWYLVSDFKNAPLKLYNFYSRYPKKPGLPIRLKDWADVADNDKFDPDYLDDNRAVLRD